MCKTYTYSVKSSKIVIGIRSEAIDTIYKEAILPLLTYGAPVWIEAMKYWHNRRSTFESSA